MSALIRLLFRICLFRNGPEDMPYAPPLLGLMLAGWLLVQVLGGVLQTGLSLGHMLAVQLVAMGVLLSGTGLVLAFKNLRARFLQTAMALVGTDAVLAVMAVPLLVLTRFAGGPVPFFDGLYLVLICWQLAVEGFIFYRALRVSPFLGLGLAFGFLVLTLLLVGALMPELLNVAA